MRRLPVSVGSVLLTVCVVLGPASPAGARRPLDDAPARYIVVLKDGVAPDRVPSVCRQIVEQLRAEIPSGREVIFRHALKGFAVLLPAGDTDRLEQLNAHPEVAFVAEDLPLELHAQIFQAGMERIRVRDNALTGIDGIQDVGMDVDIAILDTGIDSTHPDLFVHESVSFVSDDATVGDPHGHGTHVAGIAAAIDDDGGVYGVAPGARLWSVRVVDQNGIAALSDLLSGLDYVMAHADEIDVVNMSLGAPGLGDDGNCGATVGDPLHQAVCALVDAGVVVVVSAGNHPPFGRDASLVRPACYDEVITVSAVVETDGLGPGAGQGAATAHGADNSFAQTFSNYGWDVDLAAPGVDVISTWPGAGYLAATGTSAAAPHVTGAAAVWIAKHGKPGDREEVLHVRDELVRLAFPQFGPDEGFSGDRESYAEPLVNVAAIDPGVYAFVEPQLMADKPVYEYGQDSVAVVTVQVKDEHGLPLDGIPGNGFTAYLHGRQKELEFQPQGLGAYTTTANIEGMLPGDYDFTVLIQTASGFERSAGCRIVIRGLAPRLLVHDYAFLWPVMNHDSFFGINILSAAVMDEKGAPLVVSPADFETTFSGGGADPTWSFPDPNPVTGLSTGITYGAHQSQITDIHSLPLGTYYADLTVTQGSMSDSATASFDMAYNDPLLSAELTSNLSSFDFTQEIAPPPLHLTVHVTSEWLTGIPGLLYLVAEPFSVRIDGEPVAGVSFAESASGPGIYVAQEIDLGELADGAHQLVVHVIDSRGMEADSNPLTIDVVRETGLCTNPEAEAGQPDTDGDGIRDDCDNCPAVSNRSQSAGSSGNPAESDFGDACKTLARLSVSSDAADTPDFFTIQEAVDHASADATEVRIDILPGAGPYQENVVVDSGQSFRFVGRDPGAGPPVVESVAVGSSVFEARSPLVLRNLVLRGQGVSAGQRGLFVDPGVSTRVSDLRLEQLEYGLYLQAGNHVVQRFEADSTVGTGILLDDGALRLESGAFRGVSQAIRMLGPASTASIEHLLIVGNGVGDGIRNDSTLPGALDLRHSTLVDCGVAVNADEMNTTIAHSILWDNGSGVSGVACSEIAWSDLQQVDCGGTNRSMDPRFVDPSAGDYRLQADSPLLDHGPDPSLYTGLPCADLDGAPRLRDHDGDGLARVDPGAYERTNPESAPAEVGGLLWTSQTTFEWNPDPSADEYHVYRALLSTLAYSAFGVCENGLDANRTDTTLTDTGLPPPGEGFFYEITTVEVSGAESTLGVGSCAERSNFTACP